MWVRVADRRVRFPAVAALARARVAPCAAGARQSADCLRPRSPRRPRVRASAAPFVSGNRPHFHGDLSRFRVPRARPGHRRTAAFRRPAPGLRLRGGCGAMLSSRAAPPAHPPRHASVGGVRAPSRSSRTIRSTAPRLSAYIIAKHLAWCGEFGFLVARTNIFIPHRILILAGRQGRDRAPRDPHGLGTACAARPPYLAFAFNLSMSDEQGILSAGRQGRCSRLAAAS